MSDPQREDEQTEAEVYRCPIHGEVEGVVPMDGPLSNHVPTPILCDACDPFQVTIVGYCEDDDD